MARAVALTQAFQRSAWRRARLMILCYHGISLRDEHEWQPALYISSHTFRQRMEALRAHGYRVLSLSQGLEKLKRNELTEPSVAITFDDGFYDFYRLAFPVLREFAYPCTVYLTTYYCQWQKAIPNLLLPYLLWKHGGRTISTAVTGRPQVWDLRTSQGRVAAWQQIQRFITGRQLNAAQKDDLVKEVAGVLGHDHEDLSASKLFRLMNAAEVAAVSRAGIDVELHTHRHRTPRDRDLFCCEIRENRARILELTGRTPVHFCYPSGDYDRQFLPWLEQEGVRSATTCEPGIAAPDSDPLLLPRFLDSEEFPQEVFEAVLSGFHYRLKESFR